jgi:hypothetical protein
MRRLNLLTFFYKKTQDEVTIYQDANKQWETNASLRVKLRRFLYGP